MGKNINTMVNSFSSISSVYPTHGKLKKIESPAHDKTAMGAIGEDWEHVGKDLYHSIEKFEETRKRA